MVKAILFDFDGVLADSERLHYEALTQALSELGATLSWNDYLQVGIGLPDMDAVSLVLQRSSIFADESLARKVLARKTEIYDAWLPNRLVVPDGMPDIVRALAQQFTLAIASGAFRYQIETVLQREGVKDYFAVIVSSEDVTRGKPDPEPFWTALARLNELVTPPLRPHECLVVEDAPSGIAAALSAGMRCVAITTNFPKDALQSADVIVGSLKDLLLPSVWECFCTTPLL